MVVVSLAKRIEEVFIPGREAPLRLAHETPELQLLQHFGSPDAILGATREELESVPGVPGKLARELYRELHKTGV